MTRDRPVALRARSIRHAAAILAFVVVSTASSAGATSSRVESYDLGETTVIQRAFDAGSRFHEMPVALRGVLAVPTGPGPFPVALFLHGSYPFCDAPEVDLDVDVYPCPDEADLRQYEGFGHLLAALADHGYVALAPDLSAEFNNGFGEPAFGERTRQIIAAQLAALAAGDGFGLDLAGKVDPARLAIIGHSRGGSLALDYIGDGDHPAEPAAALVLLTPAAMVTAIPDDLPTALVIAECDGDVGVEQPLRFVEQLAPLRPALSSVVMLPGGTHEAFSTQLEVRPSPDCGAEQVMPARQQQVWTAAFLPAFLDLALSSRLPEA